MIKLHQYPPAFNLPSLSPFCVKVEFFLKIAGLPYETVIELNPAKGPKGKMPFIVDSEVKLPDSSFIIDHLLEKYELLQLKLNPENEALACAFKTMFEESLYFILLYSRWVDSEGFRVVEKEFTPLFPPGIGKIVLACLRRRLRKQALAQGLARHTSKEVYELGKKQIAALALFLGEKEFFFENKVSYFDATAYSFLLTILKQPIESPLKRAVLFHDNLCGYVKRLEKINSGSASS